MRDLVTGCLFCRYRDLAVDDPSRDMKEVVLKTNSSWFQGPWFLSLSKTLLNCLDYGHILGQINPSTQKIVDHRVESLSKPCVPNLESKIIWETKPKAKKHNTSINNFLFGHT